MKTVVITGGSRGIGRACAELCGARGWNVAINYAGNEAAAREAVALVEKAGGKAFMLQGDVAKEADVQALFRATVERFGVPDALINNAGITDRAMKLVDMDLARLQRMFDVNIMGSVLCAREAARVMSKSRGGRGGAIVNMSSAVSRLGAPGMYVDYAASKGAIDSFTLGLARELGAEGIRVNAIRPGIIETEIHALGGDPDRAKTMGPQVPLARAGTAHEVAEAAIWLIDDASSYVTAAIIDVTGGR